MRVYTIHHDPVSVGPDGEFAVVKEGFCWPALLFTALWALWHRMWLVFVLLFVSGFVIETAMTLSGADDAAAFAIGLGYSAFVGFGANDWRRWTLKRRGLPLMGVVAAPDAEAALHRYIDQNPGLGPRRRASPDQVLGLT